MSDFLTRLVERQFGAAGGVAPRLPSRFAALTPPEIERESAPAPAPSVPPERAPQPNVVLRATDVEAPPKLVPLGGADPPAAAAPRPPRTPPVVTREPAWPAEHRDAEVERSLPRPTVTAPQITSGQQTVDHAASARIVVIDQQSLPAAKGSDASSAVRAAPAVLPAILAPPSPLVPRRGAAPRLEVPPPTSNAPVVNVTIGRVEVRAVVAPPPARERRKTAAPKALSLEEYLERRHGARR